MDGSDIFYFFCSGEGRGSLGRQGGGGVGFLLKIPGGGGLSGGREGGEGVCKEFWGMGGGAKYFFSGPKCPPSFGASPTKFASAPACYPKLLYYRTCSVGNTQKKWSSTGKMAHAYSRGLFRGGNGRGGIHTPVRGTMFVRDGAVTPGPSRECDITFFVKGRPKSARQSRDSTVAADRLRTVIPGVTRMSFPQVKFPPVKKCPIQGAKWPKYMSTGSKPTQICTLRRE